MPLALLIHPHSDFAQHLLRALSSRVSLALSSRLLQSLGSSPLGGGKNFGSAAMHLPVILFCALWSAVSAENSDDYDLMYVNLDNEIDNGLHPTEDRKFVLTVSLLTLNYIATSLGLSIIHIFCCQCNKQQQQRVLQKRKSTLGKEVSKSYFSQIHNGSNCMKSPVFACFELHERQFHRVQLINLQGFCRFP